MKTKWLIAFSVCSLIFLCVGSWWQSSMGNVGQYIVKGASQELLYLRGILSFVIFMYAAVTDGNLLINGKPRFWYRRSKWSLYGVSMSRRNYHVLFGALVLISTMTTGWAPINTASHVLASLVGYQISSSLLASFPRYNLVTPPFPLISLSG